MEALVTIAGVPLPEPSKYSSNTSTLVDSGRNVEGKVIGSVVRSDVAKVEIQWRYLTVQQWANILGLFTNNFYNSVRFFNQSTGDYSTRDMYVGDRKADIFRRDPESGKVLGYVDCGFSLVEV